MTEQEVAEKREANVRAVIDAASWVVKLFGTDDAVGKAELREEVDKLRNALRVFRRDDHPHVTALKTGPSQSDEAAPEPSEGPFGPLSNHSVAAEY